MNEEAIPLTWINEHIAWLEGLDNAFSTLTALDIRIMVKRWKENNERINKLPSVQPEQRWIPSGEKPPEEGSYLVWMPFAPPKHRMTVAKYCGGYWNIKTPISAWMPLPEPYQGEDQNDKV